MTRLALPALLLLLTTGCFGYGVVGGPEVALDGRAGGVIEAQSGIDSGAARVATVLRGRGGPGFGEGGLGLDVCHRTWGWRAPKFCGRLMALELGARDGDFALGVLSPSVSIGLWSPVHPPTDRNPVTDLREARALEANLNVGIDVRPLNGWKGTTGYVGLTVGYAFGTSNF